MAKHSHDNNDELVKARRRQQQAAQDGPRAEGGSDPARLLSALGNARVQRLMRSAGMHRAADGSETVDDQIAQRIQSERGGGSAIEDSARRNLESSLGEDFSDVRVHTDGGADSLNRAVKAEAFTTGKDIFFRGGSYSPGSSEGQKLLAHELTHVVQQRNAPPASEMTVSDPDDASEREAGQVADSYSAQPAAVSRQTPEEEEEMMQTSRLDRQTPEEEEEMMQTSRLERQTPEEEEEMMQTSRLDRQTPEEEEEMMQTSRLERQTPEEEEEMMQTSRLERQTPEEEEVMTSRRRD